ANAEHGMTEGAWPLPAEPSDGVHDERARAAIIFRRGDEDDLVGAEHLGEAHCRLRSVVGLQILVEDRHVKIAEIDRGDLDAGRGQLFVHMVLQQAIIGPLADGPGEGKSARHAISLSNGCRKWRGRSVYARALTSFGQGLSF